MTAAHTVEEDYPTGPVFDRNGAAKHIGVSPRTIDRMVATGAIRAYRVGRCVRIFERDLMDALSPVISAKDAQ